MRCPRWHHRQRHPLSPGGSTALLAILVLAGATLLYAITARHHQRFDLTRTRRFTLAPQSLELLQGLQQPLTVLGFFRLEDPEGERFVDLLQQYARHTRHLTYKSIDPDHQPALAQRYNVIAYQTVVVVHNGKEERLLRLDEAALTNAILKLTRQTRKRIYFVGGHGEPSPSDPKRNGYSLAQQRLHEQNYVVKELLLPQQPQVPDDAAVVVLAGPRHDLLELEYQALSAFLERGGQLLCLLDPDTAPGMSPFLRRYGLELGNNFVIETNAFGRLFGGDYNMPTVTAYGQHPLTRDFDGLMTIFPVVRSVRVAIDLPPGLEAHVLVSTSPHSWAETDLTTQRATFDGTSDHQGPIAIAAVATIHRGKGENTPHPLDLQAPQPGAAIRPARLVVFGDSDFANNTYFSMLSNGDLFLTTVSWLAEANDLLTIRPRPSDSSGPVILTAAQAPLIFWLPVVMLPALVLLSGTLVYYRRRE